MKTDIAEHFSLSPDQLPELHDLRGLEPPEPMEIILTSCAQLGQNEYFLAHLPHIPHPLFPVLEIRGLRWKVHESEDDSALVLIWRDA